MKIGKNKTGNVLIIIGALLLLSCVCWFLFISLEGNRAEQLSYRKLEKVKQVILESADHEEQQSENGATNVFVEKEKEELRVVDIDGCPYIGYLTIPKADLEISVADTWDDEILKSSLCRYYGSSITDDLVIAGHNYSGSFGKLKDLATGDEVWFTDMNGQVIVYEVSEIEVLEGTDIEKMTQSGFDLTLYTCTFGGKDRLTIRCSRK